MFFASVALATLGVMGLGGWIPVTNNRDLEGTPARIVGVICIVAAIGLFVVAGWRRSHRF